MVWEAQYAAVFEEGIIDNALTVIGRDFKPALDVFYPAEAALASTDPRFLKDFAVRALGQVIKTEFPCLAIGPRNNEVDDSDDGSHLIEVARIDIYIGVTDDGPETVTRRIMKYVRTMDAVLRTARQDFFTGMSNPFGVILDVNHAYGPIGENESIYFRSAIVELTVSLRER